MACKMLRVAVVMTILSMVSSAVYDLEADLFEEYLKVTEDRVRARSNAGNDYNLWMKQGESVTMKFCLNSASQVSVENVCWSNDGWWDDVIIKINDVVVGNFSTNDNTNWGYLWNEIYESGPIGEGIELGSGEHSLTLEVPFADSYGVEIDKVVLNVDGEEQEQGLTCVDVDDYTTDPYQNGAYTGFNP